MRRWRVEDSAELYNINGWGVDYFSINEKGNVIVTPLKNCISVDLKELLDELILTDVSTPVLIRFPDILDDRIISISNCFKKASEEYGYKAQNFIIYPIKVNQMRPVVEEIVSHGVLQADCIEEHDVLLVGHLVLADVVVVRHGAVAGGRVGRVARVADGHRLDRDRLCGHGGSHQGHRQENS